ncbi:polymer-forming cytoskeletal protein [Paenibacillus albiflavus]|uniref:Polymer-forming cytoskeletal protein n=1 Tax=Paenibacillus albiflavus TaxID=2545760 RepID=A0A4R4EEB2_9BACL|nr:polymer-forming cytoskeletal protein [Paenibacillus albiflavus]TCZ76378.1 polymer-forming cytoskeletal protein [Paenibacillus albiflavus]
MFKSKNNPMNPNTTDTLIGEGTIFEGTIKSSATIRIEGTITGSIECSGDVMIGEKGNVKCNISARDVVLAGKLHGDVTTKGKIVIASTGQLYGNVSTPSFTIQEGGIFHGISTMHTKNSQESTTPIQTSSNIASNQ